MFWLLLLVSAIFCKLPTGSATFCDVLLLSHVYCFSYSTVFFILHGFSASLESSLSFYYLLSTIDQCQINFGAWQRIPSTVLAHISGAVSHTQTDRYHWVSSYKNALWAETTGDMLQEPCWSSSLLLSWWHHVRSAYRALIEAPNGPLLIPSILKRLRVETRIPSTDRIISKWEIKTI